MASKKKKILMESLPIERLGHQENLKEARDEPAKQLEKLPLRNEDPSKII